MKKELRRMIRINKIKSRSDELNEDMIKKKKKNEYNERSCKHRQAGLPFKAPLCFFS